MKRRDFFKAAGVGGIVAGSTLLAGCNKPADCPEGEAAPKAETINWKMVTTWPKNFPGLGVGAEKLATLINQMSGGRLQVKVYGAKELVPAFEVFDTVSQGNAEMGHGAAYYWKGKNEAFQFFSAVPFGFTAEEQNAWLFHGGGMELWKEAYAPFGVIPAAAGNTGVQMAGWFNREINSLKDLEGLKMRIPGLGGEVLRRAGGTPVNLPGGELFTSLQSGVIDATEWVGPYNDLAFGLYKAAKHYYYPGWHEPGTTLEAIINQKAYDALPEDLQHIVTNACRIANDEILVEYVARNNDALNTLINEHGVDVRRLPDDVLDKLRTLSEEVVGEIAAKSEQAHQVYESFSKFKEGVTAWTEISTKAFLNSRA
jgi:TRAP-type mannitol/chloroaromatic compound transport system substrate-binding protein